MAPLKFRCWAEGKMTYSKERADIGFWKYVAYDSTTKVMQNTGLKDRQGKEIFESDILQWTETDHDDTVMEEKYEVQWDEEQAGFVMRLIANRITLRDPIDTDTVIVGNAYENPSLIQ
jgi:uncharacterized phage protein (TIGR01671 family)